MNTVTTPSETDKSMKTFLKEEIENIDQRIDERIPTVIAAEKKRLSVRLKYLFKRISDEELEPAKDLNSLKADLKVKSQKLETLSDNDIQLFLLRREIETVKENVEQVGEKQPRRLSPLVWAAFILIPIALYFLILYGFQWQGQDQINGHATQTAVVEQTTIAQTATAIQAMASTPIPSPIVTPTQ